LSFCLIGTKRYAAKVPLLRIEIVKRRDDAKGFVVLLLASSP
jgi:hypothetical protein